MNSETFIYALNLVHKALHELKRPADKDEFDILMNLINGYISILADFDADHFTEIKKFLLSNATYDSDKAYLLYTFLVSGEDSKLN